MLAMLDWSRVIDHVPARQTPSRVRPSSMAGTLACNGLRRLMGVARRGRRAVSFYRGIATQGPQAHAGRGELDAAAAEVALLELRHDLQERPPSLVIDQDRRAVRGAGDQ